MVIQCHSKQVLEYIRQHGKRESSGGKESSKGKKGQRKSNNSESAASNNETEDPVSLLDINLIAFAILRLSCNDLFDPIFQVDQLCHRIEVLHVTDTIPNVIADKEVKTVRPYILCCIVKNLNFTPENFKKFIKAQVKLILMFRNIVSSFFCIKFNC